MCHFSNKKIVWNKIIYISVLEKIISNYSLDKLILSVYNFMQNRI